MSHHDHAVVVSSEAELSARAQLEAGEWSDLLLALLDKLVAALCPGGVLLGHFKASLRLGGGLIFANTTGGRPLVRTSGDLPTCAQSAFLKVALIAYEMDSVVVHARLEECLAELLARRGLEGAPRSVQGECDAPPGAASP